MEEKAVLRVRDRISAALTVPYVRRAVWLMAGGLAGFLTARGLVFGKYAPFAAAGAAAAPFSTMWAVILGGAVGYLFPSPVDIPARYIAALLAVGAIRWSLSELKSIRDHPVFAPVTAFLPLLWRPTARLPCLTAATWRLLSSRSAFCCSRFQT